MQQGGSQYGVPPPEMTQFSPTGTGSTRAQMLGISSPDQLQQQLAAEAASPISSRPPPPAAVTRQPNFDELVPAVSGNFPDDDSLAAGEEVERGGVPGNRWPRQETLALLKIRSEMDAAFRDATLKGPLWDEVSRKLGELGYIRSAKKCKEKFENVHKYYKRTKEGRAGRQDGKSYRFFSQLEALHSTTATTTLSIAAVATNTSPNFSSSAPIGTGMTAAAPGRIQPAPLPIAAPSSNVPQLVPDQTAGAAVGVSGSAAGISFSSNTSTSASSESEDEETDGGQPGDTRKRKRRGSGGGGSSSRKMMAFFEGLMKQVMERQEAMQQRFLEAIEKREQDRMIREEAWKRQEMARLAQEHDNAAKERAFAASRDAAITAFLQKITGQTVPVVTPPTPQPAAPAPIPIQQQQQQQQSPPPQQQLQKPHHQHHHHPQGSELVRPPLSSELVPVLQEPQEGVGGVLSMDPASSRWPKSEVHALIKLRSALEIRYQEAGPKGPLWEEISAGMQRMGFNRSSKRCKEKWENINKYFKKVKESNKKRPEDAKTCPYFHQLDALYRRKVFGGGAGAGSSSSSLGNQNKQEQESNPNPNPQEGSDNILAITAPPPPPPPTDSESKNGNGSGGNPDASGGSGLQIKTGIGGLPLSFFEEGASGCAGGIKKPEDIVKELMEQQQPLQQPMMDDYDKFEEPDSDNMDQDDDDDHDEDDDDRKMEYKIQFQRQNVSSASNSGGNPSAAAAAAAAAAAGSFLAMVQ